MSIVEAIEVAVGGFADGALGDVAPDHGPVLKSVAGAAAGDHHIGQLGMAVDDEMFVGRVLELADA